MVPPIEAVRDGDAFQLVGFAVGVEQSLGGADGAAVASHGFELVRGPVCELIDT